MVNKSYLPKIFLILFMALIISTNPAKKDLDDSSKESSVIELEQKEPTAVKKVEIVYDSDGTSSTPGKENKKEEPDKEKKENDDEDEEKIHKKKEKHMLIVFIPHDNNYFKYYSELKTYVEGNFTNIEIHAQEYPLTEIRHFLKFYMTSMSFVIAGVIILSTKLKTYFSGIIPDNWYTKVENNKVFSIIVLTLIYMELKKIIINTGALEIYLDGDLLHSKLKTGNVLKLDEVIKILREKIK